MNPLPGFLITPRVHAVPLLHGDAGTAQTISLARKLVERAVHDESINVFAVGIVRDTPNHDDVSKVRAIWDWVVAHIAYVMDPVGPGGAKEVLRTARDTILLRAGDCDDINAVLLPTLLGSVGYCTRVVTVAVDPSNPDQFSHVYCEVDINGEWVALDAARPGAQFGLAPHRYFKKKIWAMTDSGQQGIFGMRRRALDGMARLNGLGDFDAGDAADIIRAGTQGTAQIISATQGYPVYSASPYSSFGASSPYLGYPAPVSPLSVAGIPLLPLLLIGALVLLVEK